MKKMKFINIILIIAMFMITAVPVFAIGESETASLSQDELYELEANRGIKTVRISDIIKVEKKSNNRVSINNKEDGNEINIKVETADEIRTIEDGFVITKTLNDEKDTLKTVFPSTYSIEYACYPDGSEGNGSLVIISQDGEVVASTGLPKVKDANGKELEALFNISDNSVEVLLQDNYYSEPVTIEYGIYASAAKAGVGSYFVYSAFNYTYKGSLTLGPRKFDEGSITKCTEDWNAVYKLFFPYSPYWTTATQTKSMKNQYWCHADFAKNKKQWNLEPKRPVVSWAKMVAAKCNP